MSIKNDILGLLPTEEDKEFHKKTALVDGVYMRNHPIRNQILKYVWAKYNSLPDVLTKSMGKLYNAVAEVYIPPKNMKNLYSYTHDGSSVYSQRINEKFITAGNANNKVAELTTTPKDGYNLFADKYRVTGFDEDEWRSEWKTDIKNASNKKNARKSKRIEKKALKKSGEWYESDNISYAKYLGIGAGIVQRPLEDNVGIGYDKRSAVIGDVKTYHDEGDVSGGTIDVKINSPLLKKTMELYKNHTIKTLSSRFHTSNDNPNNDKIEYIDTAKTRVGNSHGRNLLKKGRYKQSMGADDIGGYDNPYCRVWTHHHQYKTYENTLRSNRFNSDNLTSDSGGEIAKIISKKYRVDNDALESNSVLNIESGLVRITPKSNSDVKKCMFAITNLATKGGVGASETTSGTTMWFPPYNLRFQENVSVDWDEKRFIGRGEPIYTYTQTKRSGTLSFTLLIDHPTILNHMSSSSILSNEDYENEVLRFFAGDGQIELSRGDLNIENKDIEQVEEIESQDKTVINEITVGEITITRKDYNTIIDEGEEDDSKNGNSNSKAVKNNQVKPLDFKAINDFKIGDNTMVEIDGVKILLKDILTPTGDMETKINLSAQLYEVEDMGEASEDYEYNIKEWLKTKTNNKVTIVTKETNYDNDTIAKITFTIQQGDISRTSNTPLPKGYENVYVNDVYKNIEIKEEKKNKKGYTIENEYDFFNEIKAKDSFTYKKITDKIKYFSPAYHSITPEGFNMRLNFLHQCTRQGETKISSNNSDTGTTATTQIASNSVFGNPPFCELRIGDFINTRMIIRSMTITYENGNGMQWDLNPEGVGVQPMFANITLSIDLIGGQSLSGPVNMLNNAVSNNFYANTGVYAKEKNASDVKLVQTQQKNNNQKNS